MDRFAINYGKEKGATPSEVVPLCGQVDNYRTILEDFKKVEDFVKWMGERESEIL